MGFAKRSQQALGCGSWAAVFVSGVLEKFPRCKLSEDYAARGPERIMNCLKERQEGE